MITPLNFMNKKFLPKKKKGKIPTTTVVKALAAPIPMTLTSKPATTVAVRPGGNVLFF
jgi:hypothetical protein